MAKQFTPIQTRRCKAITGDVSGSLKIFPTPNKLVHSVQCQLTYSGGTNTMAGLMTTITAIRVMVGTVAKWELTGTQLRDWMLLHGTSYDFNGLPNTGAQITIALAPEWLIESVQRAVAWNPVTLGAPISIEIDSTATLTCVAYESISDDIDTPSMGIITLEVIKPVAGGTDFYTGKEFKMKGALLCASIYPDSTNSNEITPASLLYGPNEVFAHERLTSAQNDERLERFGLTPAASGRTANIYDIAFVRGDRLASALDLEEAGSAKIRIEAASAMAGTCSILLARLENFPRG